MQSKATTTIADLVREVPARSRVFEKHRIDYCCGGKTSLTDACAEKGLSLDTISRQLDQVSAEPTAEPDPSGMSLTELCDHIETRHHDWLRQELPRLAMLIEKVARVHGDKHPWMREIDQVFAGLTQELTSHMAKEEQVLFPLIRAMEAGDAAARAPGRGVQDPIRVMEMEHDSAGDALARMCELSSTYTAPEGACNTFLATLDGLRELELDMHAHIHKENNVLFPRAMQHPTA